MNPWHTNRNPGLVTIEARLVFSADRKKTGPHPDKLRRGFTGQEP